MNEINFCLKTGHLPLVFVKRQRPCCRLYVFSTFG